MRTATVLALALLGLPRCAMVNVTRDRGTTTYSGYAIDYVGATPGPGTLLKGDQVVTFSVTVKYLLQRSDRGTISLLYFDEIGRPLMVEHPVRVPVSRGTTARATVSQTVTIPRRLHELRVVVRLTPEEHGVDPAAIRLRYPVSFVK